MPSVPSLQLVWFKRDLRVQDQAALVAAAHLGPVLPIYIVEPGLWKQADASGRHWSFIAESLRELREALADCGQPLIVRVGEALPVFKALLQEYPVNAIHSHVETGNHFTYMRDLTVGQWVRSIGLPWHEYRQAGSIRRLGSRDGWARRWDKFMAGAQASAPQLRPLTGIAPGQIPTSRDLGLEADPCPGRQTGGASAGLSLLNSFLHERGEPYRRAMASPEPAAIHCSRLSPHLAFGTVSRRQTTQATWTRQRELKVPTRSAGAWLGSMKSFNARLHWRDHFIQKLEDEPALEFENLHNAYDGMWPAQPDATKLHAWQTGQTGLPFVDACMRCLNQTGWINFRMRAMLMSIASFQLWLPWRATGEHLARRFTDYEPGIHWSQVQMQSGTTGINIVRMYNPVKQGLDQDTDGGFTRRWIPELAQVPDEYLQQPWRWHRAGSVLDKAYPMVIIDPVKSARQARELIWGVRESAQFRRQAKAIVRQHGSRKSGIKQTNNSAGQVANNSGGSGAIASGATAQLSLLFGEGLHDK